MTTELFIPKNETLKKYIECIYILTHSVKESKTRFISFPTIFPMVVILNAECKISSSEINIRNNTNQSFSSVFIGLFREPVMVNYEGEVKEVCIYFKPLGINHFLPNNLDYYKQQDFSQFLPFEDYERTMSEVLSISNSKELVIEIESYWIQKVRDIKHPFLQNSIDSIIRDPYQSISSLANKNGISHKTLIQHFQTYLSRTPSEFKKIVRFRKALNEKVKYNKQLKLTEVSYLANYFDQSHMINNFKELTGLSPKQFFKTLTSLEKNKLNWIFFDSLE